MYTFRLDEVLMPKSLNNPVASLNQFYGGKKKVFLLVTISHSLELTQATDSANIQI